jgi:DNA-binding beta-propeller fold protein YncE
MNITRPALACLILLALTTAGKAGPIHWGSGYPYMVTVERGANVSRLCAYEAPIRAKNAEWLRRWVDTGTRYNGVVPAGVAVGNFFPQPTGKEYAALITNTKTGNNLVLASAPEVFGTLPWTWSKPAPIAFRGTLVQLAAGDPLGTKKDHLLALTTSNGESRMEIWEVSGTPSAPTVKRLAMWAVPNDTAGLVSGDFWGDGRDGFGLVSPKGIQLMRADAGKPFPVITAALSSPNPRLTFSADFTKDGFETLAVPSKPGTYNVWSAPLRPGTKKQEGPTYTGRALSGQPLPGFDGEKPSLTMTGRITSDATAIAVGAGRIFGYIDEELTSADRRTHRYDPRPDAEIAFTARFPIFTLSKGAPNYGWPLKGETFGYDIAIKNNGQTPIPAGSKLTVWFGSKYRNADTNPLTMGKPDRVITINKPIPPFDPLNPTYLKARVQGPWPYGLVKVSPEATWMKANLDQVGERWLVAKLDSKGDRTLRNNRYEAAFVAMTFHPIFRENANLGNRVPSVEGDPCSLEYLSRKTADAEVCVWERSRTMKNEDVLHRMYFDGYEIGFPDDEKDETKRLAAWRTVQDKWEGWRELDIWWGDNQSWEKYDWSYAAELHETGHLFHPLGDLYGNYVMPVWLRHCKMADGTPVQLRTNLWGPDLFGSGHAIIGPNAVEVMRQYLVGARGSGMEPWWTVVPKKVNVRVLDRNGKPVPGAEVTWWSDSRATPIGSAKAGADGRWDISSFFGKPSEPDKNGFRHYWGHQNNGLTDHNAHLFTVKIGSYQDAAIIGTTDINSHSRLTFLYQALVNPNEWTWDFKTNYAPGAPEPDFKLVSAVRGTKITINVEGPKGKYALYRSWEPAYIRTKLMEFTAGGDSAPITQDMAEADGYQANRFRAIYEITRLTGNSESLPRRISVCGLKNGKGVSAMNDGRLVVATNAGIANPFAVIFDGTTPAEEFFYHYRFGHTARKVVQSVADPKRFYVTLASSDTRPDYRFDVAVPNPTGAYDVRNEMYDFFCKSVSGTDRQTLVLSDDRKAAELNPGDSIEVGDNTVRIIEKNGTTLIVDGRVFPEGARELRFNAQSTAGMVGDRAEMRELRNPGGLACLNVNGREYVAIADTGNGRIVVWDDKTTYIAKYEEPSFIPMTLAADPTAPGTFWVAERSDSGQAYLKELTFDGASLKMVKQYPLLQASTSKDGQLGLATIKEPYGTARFAVSDAEGKQVLEYRVSEDNIRLESTLKTAIGVCAGDPIVEKPLDVAYVTNDGALQLFALDSGDRLVRLR